MNRKILSFVIVTLTLAASLILPGTFHAAPAPDPNISVVGYFGTDKAQRGRPLQAAIVIDVPSGASGAIHALGISQINSTG